MIIRKSLTLLKRIEAFNEPLHTVELLQSLSNSNGIHGEAIQRDESKIICIYPSVHSQQCKPCAGAAGLADTTSAANELLCVGICQLLTWNQLVLQ